MKTGKLVTISAVVAALSLFAMPASAQDTDDGAMTQGEDAVYIRVTHMKFKPGKRERAMEIVAEHFRPAGADAGLPGAMLAIHYQTGKWDVAWVSVLEGGMADLEWYRSPNNIKWWNSFVEREGGEEAAAALMSEFQASVADTLAEVGHYHTGEEAE
jgi:hypothetical protein